jgi:hypothetical protein
MNWILLIERLAVGILVISGVVGLAWAVQTAYERWIAPYADKVWLVIGAICGIGLLLVFCALVGALFVKGELFP